MRAAQQQMFPGRCECPTDLPVVGVGRGGRGAAEDASVPRAGQGWEEAVL